jgi:hypothetical protein
MNKKINLTYENVMLKAKNMKMFTLIVSPDLKKIAIEILKLYTNEIIKGDYKGDIQAYYYDHLIGKAGSLIVLVSKKHLKGFWDIKEGALWGE